MSTRKSLRTRSLSPSKSDVDTDMRINEDDVISNVKDDLIEMDEDPVEKNNAATDFKPINAVQASGGVQFRRVIVPNHRYTPLRDNWTEIFTPLVEQMKLQVRFNPKRRCVELKTSPETIELGAIQKSADFVRAFLLGFDVKDAIALLRLDDLYVDSFEIKDGIAIEI